MTKRILHVIDHLGLGGAQAVLLDLVTLMDPTQWHCEVAVMHGHGFFAEALEKKGITVHSLSPSLWPPRYIPAFAALARNFDLFHFHLSGANALAKPLAAMLGDQPRIFHDHSSPHLSYRGFFSTIMEAALHRFSSHTITITPAGKKFLIDYEALSPEAVSVISNGVDTKLFRPCCLQEKDNYQPSLKRAPIQTLVVTEKETARSFFHLPKEAFVIGTAARLAPEKNQKMFLKAAHQALQKGLQAIFVIAGSGSEEKNLKDLAHKLGISEAVRFLGQVEERVLLYRALDLFVLSSRYEGLPIVLLEAMASGVPLVCTDLEGIRYTLEGGLYGLLVPSEDTAALAKTFLNLDHAACAEMAARARHKVERDFSSSQAAAKLGALYQRLIFC